MTPFGEKVRQLRESRGILMKKMATDLGVSRKPDRCRQVQDNPMQKTRPPTCNSRS